MWPVATLVVLGAVARAIPQAPLFRAHSGYGADRCHPCLQMPENNDDILYLNNREEVKSAGLCLSRENGKDNGLLKSRPAAGDGRCS